MQKVVSTLVMLATSAVLALAAAPNTPTVTSPFSNAVVNAADVHMETGPFFDSDSDGHSNTDWQISSIIPSSIVWSNFAAIGTDKLHTHLGQGVFVNALAGKVQLAYDTDYRLQVRHRDNTGAASAFADQPFHTAPATAILPLLLEDAASSPAPRWTNNLNADVILPATGSLRVESTNAELIVGYTGTSFGTNIVTNPSALPTDRVIRLNAGSTGALPASTIRFTDEHGVDHIIYLPALNVANGSNAFFAISANGSTYYGDDFSTQARGAPVPWAVSQPGFQVDVVATGFQLPIGIAFVPSPGSQTNSPYFYVAELYGNVKVVTRDGTVGDYASNLLNFNPTGVFPGSGELGVGGILVEPASGDVLVSLIYSSIPGNDTANKYPKVIRLHSTDGGLTASTTNTVLDMVGEVQGPAHQVSNLTFGPDGKLYVHNGDGMVTANAQNLNSFQGKILRMNLSGTPASDNPFFNAADGTNSADYVFSYGHRNPFGGAWRASDGFHYEVENGPNTDRFARVVSGRNYLWDGFNTSMTNYALYNWGGGATAPVHVQFIQSSVFAGSGFPSDKFDHAFVTESGATYACGPQSPGKRISEFVIDGAGNLVSGPNIFVIYNGSGKATAAGLATGPDGLYFTDLYRDTLVGSNICACFNCATNRGANVLRVKFVGTADFVSDTATGRKPLTVQFSDTSNVPSPTNWLWDFGDGGTSTNRNPSHLYVNAGSYNVRLQVTGSNGASVTQKNGFITASSTATENGGVIIFEAEEFSNKVDRISHSWDISNAIPDYSGSAYMEASPDNGANTNAPAGPELQYAADFSATGTRYVWLRGYATNGSNDSVHAGIDGVAGTATNIQFLNSYNAWVWTNKTIASTVATISVGSTGVHTINVWMREDGFRLDRVLLTTNATFLATLGNVFHLPSSAEPDLVNAGFPTMRFPLNNIPEGVPVRLFTGNQFQPAPAGGNQLQAGSTIFYKRATDTTWSSLPMAFMMVGVSAANNKFYSNAIPAGIFSAGDTVQYYFKIPYDDHLPTFIYGNDNARFNSELESAAQADPFTYTVQPPLQPSGSYIAVTNSTLEARVYQSTGHIALTGPDLAGTPFANTLIFEPPAFKAGGESMLAGRVLSTTTFGNGLQLVQAAGATSIISRLTFPFEGVMRYEVIDWGGLPVSETSVTAPSDASEHAYGFGEKFADFDKSGKKVHIMTEDQAGDKSDDAYKVAPWFVSTKGYGFHLDDSTESWFDMRNQFADRYVISNFVASSCASCITNALKFNIVYGPRLPDVITRYTGYTGRPPAPPKWAFAPWMSSDIWHDGGEVRYAVQKYRTLGIPGSTWVFDSPWERAYNDFQWNTNQFTVGNTYEGTFYNGFGTIGDMMTFLRTNGFYVVCWMTPFINTSSNNEGIPGQNTGQAANYAFASNNNYFVRASVGGPPLVANWWKGAGSPVDFTNPNAKLWLQNQLSNLVAQSSSGGFNVIGGFKTDDGESGNPSNNQYIPTTAVYADGRTGIEMRNGYCAEYHKAIWNVLGTNGLLFARSGFTGSHAYPGYWAGDNQPNFNEPNGLPGVVIAAQSAAMSGFSIWASDIGGYQNGNFSATQTNLFMRWTQFGAFSPLMQMHRQVDVNTLWQYPWGYGASALTNYQFYARLHTSLFPYIYSYAVEGASNGLPIIRPLVLMNQSDSSVYGVKQTFLFGNELLISQIITGNATTRNVQLPQGKWHDFFTNVVYTGGQTIVWTNSNQAQMPLFVRDGGIIPMISTNVMTLCESNYVANANLTTMGTALEFLIYPTTNSNFTVYDGTSVNVQSNGTVITANLTSAPRSVTMRFRGGPAAGVERDGVRITTFTNINGFVQVTFNHTGGATQIRFGPDTDVDGIPDSWAQTWFGTQNVCGSCDADGDGFSNSQEYQAGTSPLDSMNLLKIVSTQPGPGTFAVSFSTVAGMKYRVQQCDDLPGNSWTTLADNIDGTGGTVQILDNSLTGVTQRFYRARLLP